VASSSLAGSSLAGSSLAGSSLIGSSLPVPAARVFVAALVPAVHVFEEFEEGRSSGPLEGAA